MANIIRWEPFREMRRMHDALDRMMDRSALEGGWFNGYGTAGLPLDIYQTEDELVLKASIPGWKPEDIDISVSGDTLTIRGEIEERRESEEEGVQYLVRERRYSSFSRSLSLPTSVEAEKAAAEFENGVLTLTLPKAEEVKPKKISVKSK